MNYVYQRLADFSSPEEAMDSGEFLFHGTAENFSGPLRVGPYDQLLWTASDCCVAQNYIPESGINAYLSFDAWRAKDRVAPSPHDPWWNIVAQSMGADIQKADAKFSPSGDLKSYRVVRGHPTYEEARTYLHQLGYSEQKNGIMKLKLSSDCELLPADHSMQGRLFIMHKDPSLRFLDLSRGEGDLQNPDYHRLDDFSVAQQKGYDGVIIDDFAQSETWGNMGHKSLGVFTHTIDKLPVIYVPAKSYDWPEDVAAHTGMTEEFQMAFDHAKDMSPRKTMVFID